MNTIKMANRLDDGKKWPSNGITVKEFDASARSLCMMQINAAAPFPCKSVVYMHLLFSDNFPCDLHIVHAGLHPGHCFDRCLFLTSAESTYCLALHMHTHTPLQLHKLVMAFVTFGWIHTFIYQQYYQLAQSPELSGRCCVCGANVHKMLPLLAIFAYPVCVQNDSFTAWATATVGRSSVLSVDHPFPLFPWLCLSDPDVCLFAEQMRVSMYWKWLWWKRFGW